jgi:hypothetical protein
MGFLQVDEHIAALAPGSPLLPLETSLDAYVPFVVESNRARLELGCEGIELPHSRRRGRRRANRLRPPRTKHARSLLFEIEH